MRSGHVVQDYRGGFRTVKALQNVDLWDVKRKYIESSSKTSPS